MKKFFAVLLFFITAISLAGCSENGQGKIVKLQFHADGLVFPYTIQSGEIFDVDQVDYYDNNPDFSYWSETQDGEGFPFEEPIFENKSFYPIFRTEEQPINLTVVVYDEHGNVLLSKLVEKGKTFLKSEIAQFESVNDFLHWSTTPTGNEYNFATAITTDLSLYRVLATVTPPSEYTITVYDKNNAVYKTAKVKPGEIFHKSEITFYDSDEKFQHWSATPNGAAYDFSQPVNRNLSLYPVFESTIDPILAAYYQAALGKTGTTLKNSLNQIIGTKSATSYDKVKEVLVKADLADGSTTKLWGIYDGVLFNAKWDNAATWNREHVWPDSKLNGAPKGESHNLRTSGVKINGNRGNLAFAEGKGAIGGKVSGGWYPGDEHKGDVARIVMYMVVRYPQLTFGSAIGPESMFLKWHQEDPVSPFEKRRNEVIAQSNMQGNRNPFIDYADFADLIWGSTAKIASLYDSKEDRLPLFSTEIEMEHEYQEVLYFETKREYIF